MRTLLSHWRRRGARRHLGQALQINLATGQVHDLDSLGKADAPAAVQPVVHLALGDRGTKHLAKLGLGDVVRLKIATKPHKSIMDQSPALMQTGRPILSIPFCIIGRQTRWMMWNERAKQRLSEMGRTQDWLAEQFTMTPGGMQKWLAGTRQPSLDQIKAIAEKLQVSPAWLMLGIDSDDSLDGLSNIARITLRRFITAERQGLLHAATWQALGSMADIALAQAVPTDEKPLGAPLNADKVKELEQLALRAEEEHARGPRKRQRTQT